MITRIDDTTHNSNIIINNRVVYLSNICSRDGNSVYEQTKNVLEIIDKNLKCVGTSKNEILTMSIYLSNIQTHDEMKLAYNEWVAQGFAPAITILGACLIDPNSKIEVALCAAIPYVLTSHVPSIFDLDYIV